MKTTNAQIINRKAGMTLLELTVVILVLLSLIAILFVGARAWKKGSDRAANIMNIRNCQQAMRGHENMKELDAGDPFDQTLLEGYMKFPRDIAAAAITYIPGTEIQERSADVATDGNHLWLTSGLDADDADYGFKSFAETSGW